MQKPRLAIFLFCFIVLISCASSDQPLDGSGMLLTGLEPVGFAFTPYLSTENGDMQLMMAVSVVHGTMRFTRQNGDYAAKGAFDVVLIREGASTDPVRVRKEYTRSVTSSSEARGYSRFNSNYTLASGLEPGRYTVQVTHTDRNANETYSQTTRLRVAGPDVETVFVGKPVIAYPEDGERTVAASREISGLSDSVYVEFMISLPPDNEYQVQTELLRLRSDNRPAQLIGVPLRNRSLVERGVNRSDITSIDKHTDALNGGGEHHIRHLFARPENGPVRLRIRVNDQGGETVAEHVEELLFRSPNFPTLESVRELAAPLYYLMSDSEYEEMMSQENDEDMRRKWDEFWLRNYGSTDQAQTAITTYYSNVELANVYFSNFKEGWKTDMGKIFILFGQPLEMDRAPNRFVWFYSLNRYDPRYRFIFDRPGAFDRDAPYDHYVLNRGRQYEEVEYQRVQDWLNGNLVFRR